MPEDPVAIVGDPVRLTQAFVNLLNNAARYTPTGGRIAVAVEPRATDVYIRIADNGRGVAASDLERIFDLFTQVEPQASGHSGGLGVGLALVRRVVELHAGTVRAKSAGIGQGTEFDVVLPLPLERFNLVSGQSRSASGSTAQRRLRVLVVDDNRDAAESLRALLQALGHDSYVVFDGATALTAVDRLHPHLVMLDIGMPGMSGYEVADAVRAMLGKDAPVLVAVTGWGQDSDKRLAQARGFNYHFTKPMSAAALRELLEAVADTRGPAEPP